MLNHELEFFDQRIDLFEIFPAAFLWFQVQGAAKGDHIPQVANVGSRQFRILGLLEDGIPDLVELGFNAGGIDVDRFAKRFANEVELLGEGFHG